MQREPLAYLRHHGPVGFVERIRHRLGLLEGVRAEDVPPNLVVVLEPERAFHRLLPQVDHDVATPVEHQVRRGGPDGGGRGGRMSKMKPDCHIRGTAGLLTWAY